MLYSSLTPLTTTGYGDIVAVDPFARSLANLEAVIGQFYLAITVARLLFAGTELVVFVSFDEGNSWQQLRLNMPATSIRDLVIHNDDVVVGTRSGHR